MFNRGRVVIALFAIFLVNQSWAFDHNQPLQFQIKNFSQYPIAWGFSLLNDYGTGPTVNDQTNDRVLPPGTGTTPSEFPAPIQFTPRFYYNRSGRHRTSKGSVWRIVVASGMNTAAFTFTSHVPWNGDDSTTVSVTGSGVFLPPPYTMKFVPADKDKRLLVCGMSLLLGTPSAASAKPNSTYVISVFNAKNMQSCLG